VKKWRKRKGASNPLASLVGHKNECPVWKRPGLFCVSCWGADHTDKAICAPFHQKTTTVVYRQPKLSQITNLTADAIPYTTARYDAQRTISIHNTQYEHHKRGFPSAMDSFSAGRTRTPSTN